MAPTVSGGQPVVPSDDELRHRWQLNRLSQRHRMSDRAVVGMKGPGAGTGIVKIGDTVRRSAASSPTAMLWVLERLADAGFNAAPRLLGLDEAGRYVLQYLPGTTVLPPYRPWATSTRLLGSVARLLANYHASTLTFGPEPGILSLDRPDDYAGDVVGHLDISWSNVVVRAGNAVALIDFEHVDLVSPLWDIARTVRHWVPLIDPRDLPGPWQATDAAQATRLRTFADQYGLDQASRERLVQAVIDNADHTYDYMRRQAEAGIDGYVRQWRGDHCRRNRRGRDWVSQHRNELTTALLSEHPHQ
jgi:hypothetical protein